MIMKNVGRLDREPEHIGKLIFTPHPKSHDRIIEGLFCLVLPLVAVNAGQMVSKLLALIMTELIFLFFFYLCRNDYERFITGANEDIQAYVDAINELEEKLAKEKAKYKDSELLDLCESLRPEEKRELLEQAKSYLRS